MENFDLQQLERAYLTETNDRGDVMHKPLNIAALSQVTQSMLSAVVFLENALRIVKMMPNNHTLAVAIDNVYNEACRALSGPVAEELSEYGERRIRGEGGKEFIFRVGIEADEIYSGSALARVRQTIEERLGLFLF